MSKEALARLQTEHTYIEVRDEVSLKAAMAVLEEIKQKIEEKR